MEKKINNEFHPLRFTILEPKIEEGRIGYEVNMRVRVETKEPGLSWGSMLVKTSVQLSFKPSYTLVRAIAKDVWININSVFNEVAITRDIMRTSEKGLQMSGTVTELKYEDWRFSREQTI
jgi:hypothetical protein